MSAPISPPSVRTTGKVELPAYVSNGLIGLRVRDTALMPGMTLVSGFSGLNPERQIEAAASAPYPLAGNLGLNGVRLSDLLSQVEDLEQEYDFGTAELTSRFVFHAGGCRARIEVVTFASRVSPSLVCQEIVLELDDPCDVTLEGALDASAVQGRVLRHDRATPGEPKPACDGSLLWQSPGALGMIGLAYVTELLGVEGDAPKPQRPALRENRLTSCYGFRAAVGRRYRLRQISALFRAYCIAIQIARLSVWPPRDVSTDSTQSEPKTGQPGARSGKGAFDSRVRIRAGKPWLMQRCSI